MSPSISDTPSGPSELSSGDHQRPQAALDARGNRSTSDLNDDNDGDEYEPADEDDAEEAPKAPKLPDAPPKLPDSFLPMTEESTSLSDDLDAIFLSKAEGETSRVGKRASNVLKLAQEKEELMAKLREMTERLELAERRREALEARHRGGGASVDLSKPPVSGPPPSSFRNMPSSSVAPTPPIGNPALRATSQSAPSTPVPPPNNNNNHSSAFTRAQASGNLPSNPPSRLGSLGGVDYNDRPLPSPPPTAPLASGRV